MTLQQRITAVIQAIGADIKAAKTSTVTVLPPVGSVLNRVVFSTPDATFYGDNGTHWLPFNAAPFDAATIVFMKALGIANDSTIYYLSTGFQRTGIQLWYYVNKVVTDLKSYSLWAKIYALYPMLGGTFARHSLNLKDPNLYPIGFTNAIWTHGADGATPDGANFPATGFNPATNVSDWVTNNHLGYYSRTASQAGDGWNIGIGNTATGNPIFGLICRRSGDSASIYDSGNAATGRVSVGQTDGSGFFLGSCTGAANRTLYKNAAVIASNTTTSDTAAASNGVITLGSMNPVPAGSNFAALQQTASISIGAGLSANDAFNYNAIMQTFMKNLGR